MSGLSDVSDAMIRLKIRKHRQRLEWLMDQADMLRVSIDMLGKEKAEREAVR